MNYYNENDPFAAQWLRNLISAGKIPAGFVDERDIRSVEAKDLDGFVQCHFFAGIAGWPLALALADWPQDREVWTGSCPCQPFSRAGKRIGFDDPRHLWPVWRRLIAERRPPVIFGEQVASAVEWFRLVRGNLEALDYAVGCAPIEAASAGAFHKRDRFFFVADADRSGGRSATRDGDTGTGIEKVRVGAPQSGRCGKSGAVADAERAGLEIGRCEPGNDGTECPSVERGGQSVVWIQCADEKVRPVKPGIQLLAHGVSARVAKLRAIGNAIVPQVGAEFVKAFLNGAGS